VSEAIDVRDVFRVHQTAEGDAAALQGLSLTVREGETVTVLGPSGSGKSTFLRILAGLDRPSAGTVRVFGTELAKLPARDVARYRTHTVGYADQHYARALAPELTARELVGLELGLAGATPAERDRRADELLERVGLADKRAARPAELSGGEQQRVAVAASLAHRPKLFLADEPTGELDAESARLVYGTIGELIRTERCTAVIVSHDPESASIADRVIRIRDGRVSEESGGSLREESIVVGRGGWLRLPEELLRRSGIRTHASARLEGRDIVVSGEEPAENAPTVEALERPREARPVAALRRVSKGYGARTVLDGLAAMFASSTLTVVTGPSGSGKTTLLHVLGGLVPPSSGALEVRAEKTGYVFQGANLLPHFTAFENVSFAARVADAETDPALAPLALLTLVGLEAKLDHLPAELSGGEAQRVAIARALAQAPELMLCDEPTGHLDSDTGERVLELIEALQEEFKFALVIATHDPDVAARLRRAIELEDGRIVAAEVAA